MITDFYINDDWRFMDTREMSAIGYDERWKSFGQDMKRYGPFSRHTRRLLLSELAKLSFDSVLDVGCGPGLLLEEIKSNFPHAKLHGSDFSELAIEIAKENVPEGDFFIIDLSKDKINATYDVVVCSEVLEHIEDDESAIYNLACMTGKYLLISTPQGKMRKFETSGVGHVRNYSINEITQKLSANNLEIIKIIEWGFPFYSPLYRDFLDLIGAKGTGGNFGIARKILSLILYGLFLLNSSIRGDELIILAQKSDS